MANTPPKRNQRHRWPIDCPEDVREVVRKLAGLRGVGAEKLAGQLVAKYALAEYTAEVTAEAARLAGGQPPADLSPSPRPKRPSR